MSSNTTVGAEGYILPIGYDPISKAKYKAFFYSQHKCEMSNLFLGEIVRTMCNFCMCKMLGDLP